MSSLFPARLEEWEHAKAQGGFFVEQHVVRTLIEERQDAQPHRSRPMHAALAAAPEHAKTRSSALRSEPRVRATMTTPRPSRRRSTISDALTPLTDSAATRAQARCRFTPAATRATC